MSQLFVTCIVGCLVCLLLLKRFSLWNFLVFHPCCITCAPCWCLLCDHGSLAALPARNEKRRWTVCAWPSNLFKAFLLSRADWGFSNSWRFSRNFFLTTNFLFYLAFLSNLLASPVASFQLSGSNFGRVWRVWDSHDQTAGAAWAGLKKLWKNGKKSEISGTRKK